MKETIITNTKEVLLYVLINLIIITFMIGGTYLLIDLLISKWYLILEFILYVMMITCGVVMTLTVIEITK
jgi:NADH:ubiquinone oxidoreductase subunit 6 (subunit J)